MTAAKLSPDRICAYCNKPFRIEGRGQGHRRTCSEECRVEHGKVMKQKYHKGIDIICGRDGCDTRARSNVQVEAVVMLLAQRALHGNYDDPVVGEPYMASNGYVLRNVPGHPLAFPRDLLGQHPAVFVDGPAVGLGPQTCHWCRCPLTWGDNLHVDHLDDNKTKHWTKDGHAHPSAVDLVERQSTRGPVWGGREMPASALTSRQEATNRGT